jgi:nucleoside-diphosphate-sugar epimerase
MGSINLLAACKNVPIFINTGSSSEYGIKNEPMSEADEIAANTNYALSKALISNLIASEGLGLTLRLFSVYGYYEEKHRLISYLIYSLLKGKKAKISNLANVRDFIFIEDVSSAYEAAIKNYDRVEKGEIFNVGTGKQIDVRSVIEMLGVETELKSVRQNEPNRMWQANISKIEDKFKWHPKYSLEEGLEKTKKWMLENIKIYDTDKNDKFYQVKGYIY